MPEDRPVEGVDLLDHLGGRNDGPPHECLYWRMGRLGALRKGEWKLIRRAARGTGKPTLELYHLATGIGESENLAAKRPDRLAELEKAWERLNSGMIDPVWTPAGR